MLAWTAIHATLVVCDSRSAISSRFVLVFTLAWKTPKITPFLQDREAAVMPFRSRFSRCVRQIQAFVLCFWDKWYISMKIFIPYVILQASVSLSYRKCFGLRWQHNFLNTCRIATLAQALRQVRTLPLKVHSFSEILVTLFLIFWLSRWLYKWLSTRAILYVLVTRQFSEKKMLPVQAKI